MAADVGVTVDVAQALGVGVTVKVADGVGTGVVGADTIAETVTDLIPPFAVFSM